MSTLDFRMSRLVLLTLAAIACLDVVYGYGSGAPNGSCVDMVPQHHTPPQTSVMPYTVVPLKKTISPGEKLSLLITPTSAVKEFKGFLVQARVGDTPVGQFTPSNSVKVIDCGTGKAVSELNSSNQNLCSCFFF